MKSLLIIFGLVSSAMGILNGSPALPGEFPFMVQLHIRKQHNIGIIEMGMCAGSIVSSDVILTAAHCVRNINGVTNEDLEIRVIAGELRWDVVYSIFDEPLPNGPPTRARQIRLVKKIVPHEAYNHSTKANDIAILVLTLPLTFNEFVGPIRVPAENQIFGGETSVGGWGRTSSEQLIPTSLSLQKARTRILSTSECDQLAYSHLLKRVTNSEEKAALDEAMSSDDEPGTYICTAGENRSSLCNGDSGGPLVCTVADQEYACGVLSFGLLDDCSENDLNVFTAVANFSGWIQDKISEFNSSCDWGEFGCRDGSCVPLSYQCDRKVDCKFGTDELNCVPCNSSQFLCTHTPKCIDRGHVCNDLNDCGDGSDELGCGFCKLSEFRCNDGSCINKAHICDGKKDCLDNASDELGCDVCHTTEFRCGDGKCVPGHQICDGVNQCVDGTDELGCGSLICNKNWTGCFHKFDFDSCIERGCSFDARTQKCFASRFFNFVRRSRLCDREHVCASNDKDSFLNRRICIRKSTVIIFVCLLGFLLVGVLCYMYLRRRTPTHRHVYAVARPYNGNRA